MNRNTILIGFLSVLLVCSITGNAYLYSQSELWEESLHNQASSSAYVERLFIESGADLSFEGIKDSLKKSEYPFLRNYEEIDTSTFYINLGMDSKTIKINEAELMFQNGKFQGTKVFIPNY